MDSLESRILFVANVYEIGSTSALGASVNVTAGTALHLRAFADGDIASMTEATAFQTRYRWEFTDNTLSGTAAAINTSEGYNAAHVWDKPGTYSVTFRKQLAGSTEETKTLSVVVNSPPNTTLYVDSSVGTSGDGKSPGTAIKTFADLQKKLDAMKEGKVIVQFRVGKTFNNPSAGSFAAIKLDTQSDVIFESYQAAADVTNNVTTRPILLDQNTTASGRSIFRIGGTANNITVRNLQFSDSNSSSADYLLAVTGVMIANTSGMTNNVRNVTVKNCNLINVSNAVNVSSKATGLLVQGMTQSATNSMRQNLVYFQGSQLVVQGNTVQNSTSEHGVRVMDNATRFVAIANNDIRVGTLKENISLRGGALEYVWKNKLHVGRMQVGDSNDTTKVLNGQNSLGPRWIVVDSNEQLSTKDQKSPMRVEQIAANVIFRNNTVFVDTLAQDPVFSIAGSGSVGNTSKVVIANNTIYNSLAGSQRDLIRVESAVSSSGKLRILNNLHVVMFDVNRPSGTDPWTGYNIKTINSATVLNSFSEVSGNVWADRPNSTAAHIIGGTGQGVGHFGSDDVELGSTAVGLNLSTWRSSSATVNGQGNGTPLVFRDKAGAVRSTTGATSAGALQTGTGTQATDAAPSSLSATATSPFTSDITWTDTATHETDYVVERATDSGFTQDVMVAYLPTGSTAYSDGGLDPSTQYHYRVYTFSYDDPSSVSTTSVTTSSLGAPAAPSGLSANVISSDAISLSWTDNSSTEDAFVVERATNSGFTANVATVLVAANATSYSDTGLTANTTYYYRVRSSFAGAESANTSAVSPTTSAATPPTAPSSLSAVATSAGAIDLEWTDAATTETGYLIDRATNSSFTTDLITYSLAANSTAFTDVDFPGAANYFYRVRADRNGSASSNSNTASTTAGATGVAGFTQDANGIISIEAEHYSEKFDDGVHAWVLDTSTAGYSGTGTMRAGPDSGTPVSAGTGPRLDYSVYIATTGTHKVFVRGHGADNFGDSVHVGFNGSLPSTSDNANSFTQSGYGWVSTGDGVQLSVNVAAAGFHTFSLFIREDGTIIDKLVIAPSSYVGTPTGTGPAETPDVRFKEGDDTTTSIEAENFSSKIDRSGKSWSAYTGTAGYSGTSAMQVGPNTGSVTSGTTGPELDYSVYFSSVGTHYVWVRGHGIDDFSDSVRVGLDGVIPTDTEAINPFTQSGYEWLGQTGGARFAIDVTVAGWHRINLFMREDGAVIDKFVLTTDGDLDLAGAGDGPSETRA